MKAKYRFLSIIDHNTRMQNKYTFKQQKSVQRAQHFWTSMPSWCKWRWKVNTTSYLSLITSGDSSGSLWFWNYKTLKVIKRLPSAHKGPLVGVVWHPWENKMVTCGWDGFVKLWE